VSLLLLLFSCVNVVNVLVQAVVVVVFVAMIVAVAPGVEDGHASRQHRGQGQ
jgi:hypothetical protein